MTHRSSYPRPFLTVREVARELRLDESTVYPHLREGRFPGAKLGGRYLIPTALIEELAAGALRRHLPGRRRLGRGPGRTGCGGPQAGQLGHLRAVAVPALSFHCRF